MILNSYAILLAFVAALRLLLGVLVVGVGLGALASARPVTPEGRTEAEDRSYLVFLLAVLLVGLNVVSWPLLYLLLQSYVVEWPGVMCIYGVTQVGKGSLGASRFLPDLLAGLQLTKPALVFASGAWFVLYLLNRRTRSAPLLARLFVALLPLGALASIEAAAELAYVGIPKKEEMPPGGCCVAGPEEGDAARLAPPVWVGEAARPWLIAGYYASTLALVLALFFYSRPGAAPGPLALPLLLLGGLVALGAGGLFLVEVAAPALLQLPDHHCVYDLIPQVPESIVAVTLGLGGGFFLGWACVARWFGRSPETEPLLPGAVRILLRLSLTGYLASLVMLTVELALT
jgi:hypothetical protein